MMLRVDGLEQRPKGSGVWKYRRAIPPHLRDAFDGKWQIIRSLKTKDKPRRSPQAPRSRS